MGRRTDTVEKPVKIRRMVYAICEGFTEKKYLENFNTLYWDSGQFEISFPYDKETFDRNQSDRMQLVQMMEGEMALRISGKYTPYMYVSKYLHDHLDNELEEIYYDKKGIMESINKVRDQVMDRICSSYVDEKGFIIEFEPVERLIKNAIRGIINLSEYEALFETDNTDIRYPEPRTNIPEIDRFFIVFDRDLDKHDTKRTDENYKEVFRECDKLGYRVLMSTPLFEFWLLMHHEDAKITGYKSDLGEKGFILEELRYFEKDHCTDWNGNIEKVKSISNCRMKTFYGRKGFETAVKKSKTLETDRERLLNTAGSNIGVELESLIS